LLQCCDFVNGNTVPFSDYEEILKEKIFYVGILKATEETGSGSIIQWYGSTDPEPYKNFTDLEHW
jgi:hypothetical protein